MMGRMVIAAVVGISFAGSLAAKETLVNDVAEFDAAIKAAKPGDEIVLADGEWTDAKLVVRGEGTLEAPIIVRARTPGGVTFVGTSSLRIGGKRCLVRDLRWKDCEAASEVVSFRIDSDELASSCILYGCAVLGDKPTKGDRKWVSIYGDNNSVAHCRFEGKQSAGTLLVVWLNERWPVYHRIYANFFGPREKLGKNGGEIIRIGDSKTSMQKASVLVAFNYFYRCAGEAEIISNKSHENNYERNIFVGCGGALTLRHGNGCKVLRNAFFGDGFKGTGGVRIIGEDHVVANNLFYELTGDDTRAAISLMNGLPNSPLNGYFQVKNAEVRGNTLIGCKESVVLGLSDQDRTGQDLPPTGCTIAENLVVTAGRPVFVNHASADGIRQESNVYFGGELGLETKGWHRLDRSPAKNIAKFEIPRVKVIDSSAGVELVSLYEKADPLPQSAYGPEWMPAGEEYLPTVLKPQPARPTTK